MFHQEGRYLIFADEDGDYRMPPSFSLDERRRIVVLEEYAHALHGDVYDDDPAAMSRRTLDDWQIAESYAKGYAAERLAYELERNGKSASAKIILGNKDKLGWRFPSDPGYTTAFSSLGDERGNW